jgi:hypothetical protein
MYFRLNIEGEGRSYIHRENDARGKVAVYIL